jgi:hypothetical protein
MGRALTIVPLYPSEDELARLVMGDRAQLWRERVQVLERHGFPPIDPLMGGRYLPAVRKFLDSRHGLAQTPDIAQDEGESF